MNDSTNDNQFSFEGILNLTDHQDPLVVYGTIAFFAAIVLIWVFYSLVFRKKTSKNRELDQRATSQPGDSVKNPSQFMRSIEKTRTHLISKLTDLFNQSRVDEQILEHARELLYKSDVGTKSSEQFIAKIRTLAKNSDMPPSWAQIQDIFHQATLDVFAECETPGTVAESKGLKVVLIIGVNGVGKTTTVGKLAALHAAKGLRVMLCAGDTYRAAAIEQLQIWGERLKIPVIHHQQGSDPASVVHDAIQSALAKQFDILLIDTAGRLHNKEELMNQLNKMTRVMQKAVPQAPHETYLVIDANTGQNAIQQATAFGELTKITGIIATKLDGTAKGGVLIGLASQLKIPISYIGTGESILDLEPFNANQYAAALFRG